MEAYYLRSRGDLFVKTLGNDKAEIVLSMGEIEFTPDNGLSLEWYINEGYTEITREEFDREYVKAVEKLNQFAAL